LIELPRASLGSLTLNRLSKKPDTRFAVSASWFALSRSLPKRIAWIVIVTARAVASTNTVAANATAPLCRAASFLN
jgi:hypothetical protein